jgi:hypothetical protein
MSTNNSYDVYNTSKVMSMNYYSIFNDLVKSDPNDNEDLMTILNSMHYDGSIQPSETTLSMIIMKYVNNLSIKSDEISKDELYRIRFNQYTMFHRMTYMYIDRNENALNDYLHEFKYGSLVC